MPFSKIITGGIFYYEQRGIEFYSRTDKRKSFVFNFNCGYLDTIDTQYDVMPIYFNAIDSYDYLEFVHKPDRRFFAKA